MAAPELDLQCVASSAEEAKTTAVQVQIYEGAPESIQGKAADTDKMFLLCLTSFHVWLAFSCAFCLIYIYQNVRNLYL